MKRSAGLMLGLPVLFATALCAAARGPGVLATQRRSVWSTGPFIRWSPDGRTILTHLDAFSVDSHGKLTRRRAAVPQYADADWALGGRRMVLSSFPWSPKRTQSLLLARWPEDGSAPKELAGPRFSRTCYAPAWEPNGRRVAFLAADPNRLCLVDALRPGGPVVLRSGVVGSQPRWSPRGKRLLIRLLAGEHFDELALFDAQQMRCRTLVFPGLAQGGGLPGDQFSWAPEGGRVVYGVEDERARLGLRVMRMRDGAISAVGAGLASGVGPGGPSLQFPSWSPDGWSIAAVRREDGREDRLEILDLRTGRVRTVFHAPELEIPSWSPDGRRLAFLGGRRAESSSWLVLISVARSRSGVQRLLLVESAGSSKDV